MRIKNLKSVRCRACLSDLEKVLNEMFIIEEKGKYDDEKSAIVRRKRRKDENVKK